MQTTHLTHYIKEIIKMQVKHNYILTTLNQRNQ